MMTMQMMMRSQRPRTRLSLTGEGAVWLGWFVIISFQEDASSAGALSATQVTKPKPTRERKEKAGGTPALRKVESFSNDSLDEISGTVHIATIQDREMIGEQLERHDFQNRKQQF